MFVVDITRCSNPNSFISNMLFCVSVMLRLKLPVMIIFNKADCTENKEDIKNWMSDYRKVFVIL